MKPDRVEVRPCFARKNSGEVVGKKKLVVGGEGRLASISGVALARF